MKRTSSTEETHITKKPKTKTIPNTPTTSDTFTETELKQKTNNELKELCRERNLKVSGNKTQLISYLMNPEAHRKGRRGSTAGGSGRRMNLASVNKLLKACGIEDPDMASLCLRSAIGKGFVKVTDSDSLDEVFYRGPCLDCKEEVTVTVRMIMYQTDYPGMDYEDGADSAVIECGECESRMYLTRMCEGKTEFDSGKYHNHCTSCRGFGKCLGDYRQEHCENCNRHFYSGPMGFSCSCQGDSDSW
eukprot:TRINITY_DN8628_c0_g1_i1.p1 TRINITY_DN8628_c0_g1~~TRINITY_DN8628_c0_g1_i1.p1  ORF type:complete len:278 (+),score=38.89 TRINITY_DN8628_c0_g1_i1:98-835(+)